MGPQIIKRLYNCTIGSILTGCITAWYCNCLASDCKELQRVVYTAQYITGAELPTIQDLYTRRCQRKALTIVKDSRHQSHRRFSLLLHGKQYQCTVWKQHDLEQLSFYPPSHKRLIINKLIAIIYFVLTLTHHQHCCYRLLSVTLFLVICIYSSTSITS
jgi:hypothetical protein